MRRFLFLLLLATLVSCALALVWLPLPMSAQEASANTAKALDFLQGIQQAGGLIWWTPNFLSGMTLASSWAFIVTSLWLWLWTSGFGLLAGPKLATLACLPIAAGTMYWFARRITTSNTAAFIAAIAYLLFPSLWMRMAGVEHVVVVTAMALIPLVCLAILHLAQSPRTYSSLLCAMACCLLLLTYGKVAILMLPCLLVFVFWALWKNCGVAAWLSPRVFWPAFIGLLLLGVLPTLPSLRETQVAALFDFEPLEGWQHSFSSKSALVWLDRLGVLSKGYEIDFAPSTGQGGAYLGIIPLVLCGIVLLWRRKFLTGYNQPLQMVFRLGAALTLFSFWLSCGSYSVLIGHLQAMDTSLMGYDFTPALAWGLLGLQVALIFWLLPPTMPLRLLVGTLLSLGYLLVAPFPFLIKLPLYNQIRAPFDFFQVCAPVWVALATGCAGAILLRHVTSIRTRMILIVAGALIWAADIWGYTRLFHDRAVPPTLEKEFLAAAEALKESPSPGSIIPISGRYFYLRLPALSGKPLMQESFQGYLQQRDFSALWNIGKSSEALLPPFLRVAGVSYVFYDKSGYEGPASIYQTLSTRNPILFENEDFAILQVTNSLAPAFVAQHAIHLEEHNFFDLPAALDATDRNVLPIGPEAPPSAVGQISEGNIVWNGKEEPRSFPPFLQLANDSVKWLTHDKFTVDAGEATGWLVITQAWHSDWRAEQNGKPLAIRKALDALPAVYLDEPGLVTFRFTPPWWYNASILVSAAAWAAMILFVLIVLIVPGLRKRLGLAPRVPPAPLNPEPIGKALVICPTYNEKESILTVLEEILGSTPRIDVLVIDDASPDGTADLVKAHPEFGKRVKLLERSGKLGLGTAYRDGFEWAGKNGYEACLEIDADLSHDPRDIPRLLEEIDAGADAAIGSRYLNGLRVVNWPPHRLMLSSVATQFVRLMTGLPLTDSTSGFKALRVSALDRLNWKEFRAEGYGFQVELHYFLWKSGARLVEVPITFTERREGHTKMTPGIAVEALRRVIQLTLRRNAPVTR